MNTLVTGATGLVGYNIVQTLLNNGRKVRVMVRSLEKGKRLLPEACELVQGDVTDINSIRKALQDCAVVYHAAGFPEQWMKHPDVFMQINAGGTDHMVNAALESGVQKFIYTSTIDVFAANAGEQYDESTIDTKEKGTFYERSKQKADQIVVQALEKGLPAVFLHPSGVYGPGPTDSPGTNDFIRKLKNKEIPILLPGGYPIVFAEDIGKGHYLAEQKAAIGSRYILSEAYYDLQQLARIILEELRSDGNVPKVMPYAIGKAVSVVGELAAQLTNTPPLIPKGQLHFLQWKAVPMSTKAQQELDWTPTPTREGIRKTIDYLFRNQ